MNNIYIHTKTIKEKKKSRKEKEEKESWFFHVKREKGQGADTHPGQNKLISVLGLLSLGVGSYVAREALKTKCSERSVTDKKV